jgi:sugar/nucleoside kinase (ribokinase family)
MLGESFEFAAVKLDARGAVLCARGEIVSADAEPIEEADPTGAGDAFDGVLLAALVAGSTPQEALGRACHAGALAASDPRGWPSIEAAARG